ncbi:MAG: hypothetical protein DRP81_04555 [Candidatus Omnitrophota bacterium]|nr:MAG: hypothetical protein DRP72_01365 [Candidatus Omnitrophota bacterium]RKY45174.1 MAG: hypothetical protein DRP81_04555 [Candidatus Omnitrophota bacterium]
MTSYRLIFFISSSLLLGCVTTEYNVATHKQDIFIYSTDKEVNLGRNLHRRITKEFKLSKNPFYIKRVRTIGEKIVEVCDRRELNYRFYVIDEDEKNAFSIPGGYVYINKGLLDILDSDDEVAFVLAHEIAHIVARHSIKKLQAALGCQMLILVSLPAEKSASFYQGLSFALAQIMSGYSREDEFKADELAVKYSKNAGFSPSAGIKVLEKLYQSYKKEKAQPLSYFRTHPFIPQRVKHIKEILGIPLTISDYMNE